MGYADVSSCDGEREGCMIFFLHGASSSGKSSIAQALREKMEKPLLCIGIDWLYDTLSPRFFGTTEEAAEGFWYARDKAGFTQVTLGETGKKIHDLTMPLARVFVGANLDLAIDEVLYSGEGRAEFLVPYAELLASHRAYFIRVDASLAVLEAREKMRNRVPGTARSHFFSIHSHGYPYDFTVSSDGVTASSCAAAIMEYVRVHEPFAFRAIVEKATAGSHSV